MDQPVILAIDQGSSATKCVAVGADGGLVSRAASPLETRHPRPGWVEQDALAIWTGVGRAVADCLEKLQGAEVVGVGLSTQRESLVAWERVTGEPVCPVITWQDGRGAAVCETLRSAETDAMVLRRSGLPLDPMFTAAKASALLDRIDPDRVRTGAGEIRLGTVDAWLMSRFGDEHVTEAGNASRTQLLNVHSADWDDDLLALFRVPRACLPRVVASVGPFAPVRGLAPLPDGTRLGAVLGDSHAALFGHGATTPGTMKATYGTGSSIMGVTGPDSAMGGGVCRTIAWMIDAPVHAAEGNIRSTGATLGWLAGVLGMEVAALIELGLASAHDGVVLVPGFGGLGAPWWDRDAVGLLTNLTLGTSRGAIARAALDSIVAQVADVVEAIARQTGGVRTLFVDGGATRSDGLMQMQANRLGCVIARAREPELSAVGAAHLAGLACGFFTEAALASAVRPRDEFRPDAGGPDAGGPDAGNHDEDRRLWRRAIARASGRPSGSDVP